MPETSAGDPPIIYNLFPRLVGHVDRWLPHAERAAEMGFNWIFLNPLHLCGSSGSLYAIRDYFRLNADFFPYDDPRAQWAALKTFVGRCRERGLGVMADLVINHTSFDNPLTRDHRNWYKTNDDGSIRSPGAVDNTAPGGYVTWGDLSEIDNEGSSDRRNLHEYWWRVVEQFVDAGVEGFRCDAAYQVPNDLWRMLISRTRGKAPNARFFAESLGCPLDKTLGLAGAGFDFVFNSGKWWDYRAPWFLEQYNQLVGRGRSICFPESHDTRRLAEEWGGDMNRVRQHYLFTALVSSGVMTLLGFEYGYKKKPHVVTTHPHDLEGASFDITVFIGGVNALKRSHRVFREDGPLERLDAGHGDVLALRKWTVDRKEAALLLFNLNGGGSEVRVDRLRRVCDCPAEVFAAADGPAAPSVVRLGAWGAGVFLLK